MNKKQENENEMPVVDESWWESVLAEEARHPSHAPARSQAKPESRADGRTDELPKIAPNWTQVKDLYQRDQIVDLKVSGCNRGGLLVEGPELYGFVPFSHLVGMAGQVDLAEREKHLESYVGRTLRLKVIECVPEDGRIVFSERAAQAEPGKRSELFHSLRAGECVDGTVTNITDFGVFVDLGGVEGLIHISELSWGRVIHPNQIVKMGQKLQVQVLDLSPERCRVALSLKRLAPNPWTKIGSELSVGDVVPAVITSVLSYGAFARLELGVEGLIHASEMPLAEGQTVKDFLEEGQQVRVRVLHVDPSRQRMGLSMQLDGR
ncbi:MAG TPA: S1 RNA-binding domain-containing protein [Anaerolineales bacterium]|nr:S1 RNA-binding domain-containing protein [Anaerolineales bacterium]